MNRRIIKEGYNKIAESYSAQRGEFNNLLYLKKLSSLLPGSSSILDVGCGAGVPINSYLIEKGYSVTGIDISERQIELAKKNVLQGIYSVKDMSVLKNSEYQVDAVISFYAIFHIPKEAHQELFRKFNTFLRLGGLILVTMGSSEWEGEEDNFHGTRMYWSQYGPGGWVKIRQCGSHR